jgi:Tol biopolymer transport system component
MSVWWSVGRVAGISLVLAFLIGAAAPAPAWAQYFGQNKVRYNPMDFKVLETEHFAIHYYDEKRDAAVEAGRMAERWYARLLAIFGDPLSSRQAIVLYASHPDFRGTTVVPGEIGETTGGLTEGVRRRIVMPLAGPLAETDHVLGHELVHAFQFDVINRLARQDLAARGASSLPLWFIEGMAEYLSVGPVDAHTAMWLRDGVARDALPNLARLDDPKYFPYRWGHAFWAYVAGRYGDGVVKPLLVAAATTGDPVPALQAVLKVEDVELSSAWHESLKQTFASAPAEAATITSTRPLLPELTDARLNLGPAMSPDGKHVAFFSERDRTAIDLFIADAVTGSVKRKLTELAVDPHTDSLQFVNAAGAWSPDSRRLAFAGIARGRPELTIFDVVADQVERRIRLGELGEVFSSGWSPDGQSIVISAMAGGYVDLFIVRLPSGTVERLTQDAYTELQPAWSPDGRSIAYVTDRFTTDLAALEFGELRLALIDPATGASTPLEAFDTGKHLNPQWSFDGATLWFISDHDQVSNVYQLRLADGRLEPITHLSNGLTGIGKASPALSIARDGRMVFSVLQDGGYQLYVSEKPTADGSGDSDQTGAVRTTSAFMPSPRAQSQIRQVIGMPAETLPDASGFRFGDYRPRLSLEGIAPLQAGVGIGELGPFVTGGTAVTFGDVLGHHNLTVGVQGSSFGGSGGFLDNLSTTAGYQNQASRWTWGVTGGQLSSPSGSTASGLGLFGGELAVLEQEITVREISRELTGFVSRPFSRARRIELAGGYEGISFQAESRTVATSFFTGAPLGEDRTKFPSPGSLHMATAHAALVHDTSLFGGTSPVMGSRYRLQAGVAAGSANYVTLLADYRRYVPLAGPFSLAGRAMHYGRFGADAEDPRMQELFIGYPHLLRGYDGDWFASGDCGTLSIAGCRRGHLFGSRLAVANLELRTSLGGYRGLLPALSLPVEAALFVDAGLPWSSRQLESALDRSRQVVSSMGASLRFNLFGFAVGQLTYARANDRPGKPWRWQFSLTPGF